MIEDARQPQPRFTGMVSAVRTITAEEGLRGIYRGVGPVIFRQSANSAVRFSSYSTLKQAAQGSVVPGSNFPGWMTFGIGAMAGVITVCEWLLGTGRDRIQAYVGQIRPCLLSMLGCTRRKGRRC